MSTGRARRCVAHRHHRHRHRQAAEAEALNKLLQTMAMDAAIVLDRHCDTQAVLPVYAGTPLAEATLPLAAYLGAQALLVCKVLGDDPFDESVSGTLFARGSRRRVSRQMRVAKIAGAVACRTGNFLRL